MFRRRIFVQIWHSHSLGLTLIHPLGAVTLPPGCCLAQMGFTSEEFEHSFALLVPSDTHSRFRKYMKPRMLGMWNKEVRVMGRVCRVGSCR